MSNRKILKNGMILTLNDTDDLIEKGDLLIDDHRIRQIGGTIRPERDDEVIDCSDLLLTPGFVNAHLHSDENFFKGLYDDMPLELWMLYAYPPDGRYGNFPDRWVYLRTLIGAMEQIRSGVTCCQDDVSGHPVTTLETHNIICRAYEDIGMRANISTSELHKNYLDTIPYLREIMPEELQKQFLNPRPLSEAVAGAEEIIKTWNDVGNIKITLSPIAPQRCDDDFNVAIYELAEKYNLPYHTHICETRMQRETGFLYYGKTILQHCRDLGILSPRTTIAHGNWLDDEDVEIAGETGINIVHNIVSNLDLGSGIMPFAKLKKAGAHIALGTDGASSNDSQSIMEVMKTAALIHNVTQPDYTLWPTSNDILECATKGGARSVMRDDEIGSLEVGKKADIVMFNLNSSGFVPLNNVKNQIVYCANESSIKNVMIDGKMVLEDGRFKTVDEDEILKETREVFKDFKKHYDSILDLSEKTFPYVNQAYWKCMNAKDPLWRLTSSRDEYKQVFVKN